MILERAWIVRNGMSNKYYQSLQDRTGMLVQTRPNWTGMAMTFLNPAHVKTPAQWEAVFLLGQRPNDSAKAQIEPIAGNA